MIEQPPGIPAGDAADGEPDLEQSALGSGLLARQPTPPESEQVAIARICPQCGTEYETGSRFCPTDGSPLRPKITADPLVGTVIAERYHVVKRLGQGGMGRVYLAEHVKMNRQCALKVMNPALVDDAGARQRFAQEASNAARIIHPNVAAVFDFGESDGLVYLVMEYIPGESLSQLLEREHLIAPWRAIEIARQVADGLEAAHELGIIHRDLKPDNVLIAPTRSGREVAKVVDFGIAKAMELEGSHLTGTGLVIGTPEFMSPEQLLGDPLDARSDIYSLGCILYQMLTGSVTFPAPSREQLVKRRLAEHPPRPRSVVPELPRTVDDVVARMLARSPDDRFDSAAAVRDALVPATLLGADWDPAYRPLPEGMPTHPIPTYGTTEQIPTDEARRQRHRRTTRGLILAGAAAVVAIGVLLLPRTAQTPALPSSPATTAPRVTAPSPVPADSTLAPAGRTPAPAVDAPSRASVDARTAPAAVPLPDRAVRAPIDAYARAMESGNADRVRAAYPAMPAAQYDFLRNNFFALAEHVRSQVTYDSTRVTGERAQVLFRLRLRYAYRTSGAAASSVTRYRAQLVREAGAWKLTELTPR